MTRLFKGHGITQLKGKNVIIVLYNKIILDYEKRC